MKHVQYIVPVGWTNVSGGDQSISRRVRRPSNWSLEGTILSGGSKCNQMNRYHRTRVHAETRILVEKPEYLEGTNVTNVLLASQSPWGQLRGTTSTGTWRGPSPLWRWVPCCPGGRRSGASPRSRRSGRPGWPYGW